MANAAMLRVAMTPWTAYVLTRVPFVRTASTSGIGTAVHDRVPLSDGVTVLSDGATAPVHANGDMAAARARFSTTATTFPVLGRAWGARLMQ